MRLSVRKGEGKSNLFKKAVHKAGRGPCICQGVCAVSGQGAAQGVGRWLIPAALPLACKAVALL